MQQSTVKKPKFTKTKRPVRYCEVCTAPIPEKPGQPAKTCGAACAKIRKNKIESDRYQAIKNTQEWKSTRTAYLLKLKQRIATDPKYAALARAYASRQTAQWKAKEDRDPAKRAARLEAKRKWWQEWRDAMMQEPVAYEAYKAKCRKWYQSLSTEDRDRIFNAPRRLLLPE